MTRRVDDWADLVPYLLARDGRWHNLATGMPMAHPPVAERVREAFRDAVDHESFATRVGSYHGVLGDPDLRKSLALLYGDRFGLPISAEEVLITPGAQAAFHAVSALTAARGRRVVFFGPEYPGYRTHPEAAYDMLLPDVAELGDREFRYVPPAGRLDEGVGAVIVSRPGNPSGNVIGDEEIAALAAECASAGALLVVDNAYAPVIPGLAFGEMGMPWGDNVMLVQSFSKGALAGERLGFVFAAPPVIEELSELQSRVSTFPAQLVQLAATFLLSDDRYVKLCEQELRGLYAERHRLVRERLDAEVEVPFRLHAVDGGQFQWIHLPELRVPAAELFFTLRDRGVLLAPSTPFYLPHLHEDPHARQSFRIGVTAPVAAIEAGLGIFAEVVNEHA
ncbi:aminotransferase class I/II-fold pyridoxal phosphate-dependent enzyme [Actinomadura sp. DC4]|uniref:aminotransferase class I/II-fold pyridoxal phosphate-dependent enzyme n=1 Tax=Actinomadura sp. DC4 TaxID=3055069 RepID=UPI0025B0998A|nr:aminotransferase class I/II-fold pyridoxal phosphate-dependent enzyme [Actinomadura sp. DC4]MDN3354256.1 aminotransferase class I/II-fold pyridoxal phosphate-dependent enzyme [Actinomadura sp. DC4]